VLQLYIVQKNPVIFLLCLLLLKQALISYGDQHIARGYKKSKYRLEGDGTL